MPTLVAVGACYIDTILTVSHYPVEDEKLRAKELSRRRGGNCPNTLEVLEQLLAQVETSWSLGLISVLPARDCAGTALILESFGPGVNLSQCLFREDVREAASSFVVRSLETGSRTIVNYNSLTELSLDEFVGVMEASGEDVRWCHFEGRIPDVILDCILYMRRCFPHCKISVEVEKPNRAGLQELAMQADVVFYSKSWAVANGYSDAETCLRAQATRITQASLLCCTWGAKGACVLSLRDSTLIRCDAYKKLKASVVDTIGAGDSFIAGMLYALTVHANDWSLQDHLEFANKVAGHKVVQEGFGKLGEIVKKIL